MSNNKEYMAKYMLERYHRRRKDWIDKLGGSCIVCNTTKNLHFDHVDASSKTSDIGKILASGSEAKVVIEMAKCQLLCETHHLQKSVKMKDIPVVEHGGGVSGKRNCPCNKCKVVKNAYMREWKRKNKMGL